MDLSYKILYDDDDSDDDSTGLLIRQRWPASTANPLSWQRL